MSWYVILKTIFYSFTLVFGLVGNAFVIFFFSLKMKRASQFRWLVVHLAVSDGIYSVLTPLQFLYLLCTDDQWKLGLVMCKLVTYIGPLTVNVSAWILCLMGFERYRAICHPFSRRLTRNNIHFAVIFIWIICIGIKINIIWRLDVVQGQCFPAYKNTTENIANALVALLADSLLPMALLSYYLIRVMLALRVRAKYLLEIKFNNPKVENTSITLSDVKTKRNNADSPSEKMPNKVSADFDHDHGKFKFTRFKSNRKMNIEMISEYKFCSSNSALNKLYCSKAKTLSARSLSWSKSISEGRKFFFNFKAAIKRKRSSLNELAKGRIKEAADRAIIKVFLITVIIFFLTTFPYNAFYFIVVILYRYYFSDADLEKYDNGLIIANSWLGLLVLSGSVMNILIYSGKFPDFRIQINAWLRQKKDDRSY